MIKKNFVHDVPVKGREGVSSDRSGAAKVNYVHDAEKERTAGLNKSMANIHNNSTKKIRKKNKSGLNGTKPMY